MSHISIKMIKEKELVDVLHARKQELESLKELMVHDNDRLIIEARISMLNDIIKSLEPLARKIAMPILNLEPAAPEHIEGTRFKPFSPSMSYPRQIPIPGPSEPTGTGPINVSDSDPDSLL